LYLEAEACIKQYLPRACIGIAPHSLRAVSQSGLTESIQLANGRPFHIHIAEQEAEVREIQAAWLAQTGATVGLCPITEANLGDGTFDGAFYNENDGVWGIGTDSNVRISLSEELRTLEYSQRLRDNCRAIYATDARSTGRVLFDIALRGGAQALQRESGSIAVGQICVVIRCTYGD